ncbi:MAG: hypothetical protein JST43_01000 [Bacteroidetes bacterium]|nr:hypothetical protein [Bacteroidota bacterium]MBS1540664.1 hypothetical protein [Bacteroidota bacterium]
MANKLFSKVLNDELTIEMTCTEQPGNKLVWETILIHKKSKQSQVIDRVEQIRKPLPEEAGGLAGARYSLIGAAMYGDTIYGVLSNFGLTTLVRYKKQPDGKFYKDELGINNSLQSLQMGLPRTYAAFTKIDTDIYFIIFITNEIDGQLFKIEPNKNTIWHIQQLYNKTPPYALTPETDSQHILAIKTKELLFE